MKLPNFLRRKSRKSWHFLIFNVFDGFKMDSITEIVFYSFSTLRFKFKFYLDYKNENIFVEIHTNIEVSCDLEMKNTFNNYNDDCGLFYLNKFALH